MRTREQIIERARVHVGHREVSPNRSPLIDAWLRRCGLGPGYPWCAAFASWCVEHRVIGEYPDAEPAVVACAGALKLGRMFPATDAPQPGDLMYFATDAKGAGHVGVVVGVAEEDVLCIEGNSANQIRYVQRVRSEVQFSRTRDETWAGDLIGDRALWVRAPVVHVSYEGTR